MICIGLGQLDSTLPERNNRCLILLKQRLSSQTKVTADGFHPAT